jgi:hypothetical protein
MKSTNDTPRSKHSKSADLFNRYIWLVETIHNHPSGITLGEINKKWQRSAMSESRAIPLRTFHNHREAIQMMFDINIVCDKSSYRYSIDNSEDLKQGGVRTWLLNTFAVNHLINESHKLKSRIIFEDIPSGQKYLTQIIESMRDGLTLHLSYQSFGSESVSAYFFEPYFVKVFKQRWYVIGKSDKVRIHALDRIQNLVTTEEKFTMPSSFVPEEYFANCFGIIQGDDTPAQTIQLKVSAWQSKYLRALPLHYSQREVEQNEAYSIFEFFLKPTFDFRQEILALGHDVEVLTSNFRHDMALTISKMNALYK